MVPRATALVVLFAIAAFSLLACSGGGSSAPGAEEATPTPGHPVSTSLAPDITPPPDVAPLTNVAAVTAGGFHTCALLRDGQALCWGDNELGQLGDGGNADSPLPVEVSGLPDRVTQLSGGYLHTCAVVSDDVWCWGQDGTSQDTPQLRPPALALQGVAGFPALASGRQFTCAIASGQVSCWGNNQFGQTGTGSPERIVPAPTTVEGLPNAIAVGAGWYFACALTAGGAVSCWGNNQYGSLGNGETGTEPVRTPVGVGGLSDVQQLAVGGGHVCVRTAQGGAKCWGANNYGQLGDGTKEDRSTPVDVTGLESGVAAIFASTGQTCALLTSGGVKCWGHDWYGELGDGTSGVNNVQPSPVDVAGLPPDVTSISMGRFHTCALTSNGELWCWGRNGFGELGDGTRMQRAAPVRVVA